MGTSPRSGSDFIRIRQCAAGYGWRLGLGEFVALAQGDLVRISHVRLV